MGFKARSIEARVTREYGPANLERIGLMLDAGDVGFVREIAGNQALERAAVATGAAIAAMADNGGQVMHVTYRASADALESLIDELADEVDAAGLADRLLATAAQAVERPLASDHRALALASFRRFARPRLLAALARHEREAANR